MFDVFVKMFEYVGSRVFSDPSLSFRHTKGNFSTVKNFIAEKQLSTEDLWQYIVMVAMIHYNSRNSRVDRFSVTYCLSKKNQKLWERRTKELMFQVSKFQIQIGLKNPCIVAEYELSEEYKEILRRKNFNTTKGLLTCLEYYPMLKGSETCEECQFKKECDDYKTS